jgi:hypothetical protein
MLEKMSAGHWLLQANELEAHRGWCCWAAKYGRNIND